jgi:hypothetical protein
MTTLAMSIAMMLLAQPGIGSKTNIKAMNR